MGMKSNSGFFHGTRGSRRTAIGDAKLMGPHQEFLRYISKRKDIDANGLYDVVAHGTASYIQIDHNGKSHDIDWRVTAKIIKNSKGYHGQGIRLLSCNTGKISDGFAQNLANKLNVPVKAPIGYLLANSNGNYYVAEKTGSFFTKINNGFKTFYPKRRKK